MKSNPSSIRTRLSRVALQIILFAALFLSASTRGALAARCGGTERWFVKVGTDSKAQDVDVAHPIPITVAGLNQLPKLQGTVPAGDNKFRLPEETKVYVVEGLLALFKDEDDADYHLVITDSSLQYTPGGPSSDGKETGTSFIAEIPDPGCVAGQKGALGVPSTFQAAIESSRQKFEAQFPGGKGADKPLGIPVTVTGIAFYDRPHRQTGRAVNGIELHPILDIAFGGPPIPPPATGATELLVNSGFEQGTDSWSGTTSAIGAYTHQAAHGGQNVCWLGGYGRTTTETIAQTVTIPSTATSATLSFWVEIGTEETATTKPYDQCVVQLRSTSGQVLTTLETLSNLNETGGYLHKTYDVTQFKGRTVKVYFRAAEDTEKATSFILDDISLTVK
jgi:hypothetical protein